MTAHPIPLKRRRGGQPGNTNALRHGLYSRRLSPADLSRLGLTPGPALPRQIALLRSSLRELLDRGSRVTDVTEAIDLLNRVTVLTGVLSRLVRLRRLAQAGNPDPQAGLSLLLAQQLLDELQQLAPAPSPASPPPGPPSS
jgi:hypothetical protein